MTDAGEGRTTMRLVRDRRVWMAVLAAVSLLLAGAAAFARGGFPGSANAPMLPAAVVDSPAPQTPVPTESATASPAATATADTSPAVTAGPAAGGPPPAAKTREAEHGTTSRPGKPSPAVEPPSSASNDDADEHEHESEHEREVVVPHVREDDGERGDE